MMCAARHWIHENGQQNICVLLQKDIRNSFNEILPHEFLKDAQQYARRPPVLQYVIMEIPLTWFTKDA